MTTALQYVGAFLLSIGGGTAILFGLSSWLGKEWAARILEADRAKYASVVEQAKADLERVTRKMQAGLDHRVFVSRAQFEVELRALRLIWRRCAMVRSTLVNVRPSSSLKPFFQTEAERLADFEQHRGNFHTAHVELVAALDHNSAFIDQSVFEAADGLRNRTTAEAMGLRLETPFESGWYDRGDAAISDVMNLTDRVSAAIRRRLQTLVISNGESA